MLSAQVGWIDDSGSSKLSVVVAALVGIGVSGGHSCGSAFGSQWRQWRLVVAWASCGGGGGGGGSGGGGNGNGGGRGSGCSDWGFAVVPAVWVAVAVVGGPVGKT